MKLSSVLIPVIVCAIVAAGCGSDSGSSKTVTLPDGQVMTVSQVVDQLASRFPEVVASLCRLNASTPNVARAGFERGYAANPVTAQLPLSPREVFDELMKRC